MKRILRREFWKISFSIFSLPNDAFIQVPALIFWFHPLSYLPSGIFLKQTSILLSEDASPKVSAFLAKLGLRRRNRYYLPVVFYFNTFESSIHNDALCKVWLKYSIYGEEVKTMLVFIRTDKQSRAHRRKDEKTHR